jgi:hypothetical protein
VTPEIEIRAGVSDSASVSGVDYSKNALTDELLRLGILGTSAGVGAVLNRIRDNRRRGSK